MPVNGGSGRPGAGGVLAVIAFAVAVVFFCFAFLQRVSPAVMVTDLMRDFAVGGAILGNLSAFYFYAYAALQIPVGLLLDRLGPRRLLTAAALVCAGGCVVFATADALWLAYAGRLLIGAGCAVSFAGALALATTWFPARRFALLTGIAQAGAMAGAVLGAAPLAALLQDVGWRTVMLWGGVLSAGLAAAMWATARDAPLTRRGAARLGGTLAIVAANRQTWYAAGFGFFTAGPMLSFTSLWGVSYLQVVYGIDRPAAAGIVSLSFVGWGFCAPLVGLIADRLGARRPVMIVGSLMSCATNAAIIMLPGTSISLVSALLLLNGAVSCCMLLNFVCAKEHNPPSASGAAIGFANTAVMLSGAMLQPVIGLLLDAGWQGGLVDGARVYDHATFRAALSILPACSLVAAILAWRMREPPRH